MTNGPSHRLGELGETAARPGEVTGAGAAGAMRLAVCVARFNGEVTGRLLEGAYAAMDRLGVPEAGRLVCHVPGAFELPLVARQLATSGSYDAIVCLGTVIRGETSHYDFVAGECARGLQEVQLSTGVPVVFGVLTTENLHQALERAGGAYGNKGDEAVATAVEMVNLLRNLA